MTPVWSGTPGQTYTNNTDKILYQFVCSFVNTCGACAQYHLAIAKWWPKIHHGCRCVSRPIYPNEKSLPYEDHQEIFRNLPEDQQKALVGASNWKLIESGTVKWEDVVTSTRVRLLREVVSREKLTIPSMVKSGVRPQDARKAWEDVNTPEHQLVHRQRIDLIKQMIELGAKPQVIKDMFGEEMASRVSIGAGPSRVSVMPVGGFRTRAEWERILMGMIKPLSTIEIGKVIKPSKATDEEVKRLIEVLAEDPAEFLAQIRRGLRAGRIYPREILERYKLLGGVPAD